jgi:hypothetical protein
MASSVEGQPARARRPGAAPLLGVLIAVWAELALLGDPTDVSVTSTIALPAPCGRRLDAAGLHGGGGRAFAARVDTTDPEGHARLAASPHSRTGRPLVPHATAGRP